MANVNLGEYEWIGEVVKAGAGAATGIVSSVNETRRTKISTDSANYIASLGTGSQDDGSGLPPYVVPVAIGIGVLLIGGFVLTRK